MSETWLLHKRVEHTTGITARVAAVSHSMGFFYLLLVLDDGNMRTVYASECKLVHEKPVAMPLPDDGMRR